MKYDAKLNVSERVNKKGETYKMLEIYMTTKDGELVLVHEFFMRESLVTLIKLVTQKS